MPTQTRERPILFSSPMIRAILENRKIQTRRVVKPQPVPDRNFPKDRMEWNPGKLHYTECNTAWNPLSKAFADYMENGHCPYGSPGDRLWVKETWRRWDCGNEYRANYPAACQHRYKWKPSIFMPRWASRITLEITGVRVERLQEISEEDARAEGAERVVMPERGIIHNPLDHEDELIASHKNGFQFIWECISGLDSWDANPWVWVVEFRRVNE